jgi:hypothetical protein
MVATLTPTVEPSSRSSGRREEGGEPQDLANAVAFLASDAARYITGHVLVMDGGISSTNPTWSGQRDYGESAHGGAGPDGGQRGLGCSPGNDTRAMNRISSRV